MRRAKEHLVELCVGQTLRDQLGKPFKDAKREINGLIIFGELSYGYGASMSPKNARNWHDFSIGDLCWSIHEQHGLFDQFVWDNFNDWNE